MSQPTTYPAPSAPAPQPRRSSAGRIIGIVVTAVVILGGLAAAALFLFGAKTLDESKIQAEIVRSTQQGTGVAPTDVHCPADIALKAGAVATCTAQLDGQPVTYSVRQDDDQGNVHITSTGFVSVDKIEKSLADEYQKQTGSAAEADCADGKHIAVGGKGTTIACTVAATADPTSAQKITVTLTDDDGGFQFS